LGFLGALRGPLKPLESGKPLDRLKKPPNGQNLWISLINTKFYEVLALNVLE
jgi:hypothetical protein